MSDSHLQTGACGFMLQFEVNPRGQNPIFDSHAKLASKLKTKTEQKSTKNIYFTSKIITIAVIL